MKKGIISVAIAVDSWILQKQHRDTNTFFFIYLLEDLRHSNRILNIHSRRCVVPVVEVGFITLVNVPNSYLVSKFKI